MTLSWKTVSVFVSSTFNDMHAERDFLVKRVFPELREWCEQRKLHLIDIDLRWGITESDATNKNVIRVCLNRIDECRPFFLCFLGQRRGWVPGKNEIAPDTYKIFPELKQYIGDASVTEMEILHAVIDPMNKKERADRAFFYLRDPSYLNDLSNEPKFIRNTYTNEGILNPLDRVEADEQLNIWREKKIPATGRPIHHYSATWNPDERTPELALPLQCPSQEIQNQDSWKNQWFEVGFNPPDLDPMEEESFAQAASKKNEEITRGRLGTFRCGDEDLGPVILNDLKNAIADIFPNHTPIQSETPLQKELDQQEQFLELNCNGFIKRRGDFDSLNTYIKKDLRTPFVLTASAGMGKTMLLANWIRSYQQKCGSGQNIFYRFIGASSRTTTVDSVLRSLLFEIKESGLLREEIPIDPEELRNKFNDLLTSIGFQSQCLIVIDALDQLESGLKDLYWLPRTLPNGIKLVISFKRDGIEAENLASQFRDSLARTYYEIRPFDSIEDRKKLVNAFLDQYLKQLDNRLIQALITSPGAQNPLFLKILLSELRIYGSFANLGEKIRMDFGTTPVEAFRAVLKRLEKDPAFSDIPAKTSVSLLFGLLSHARAGLSENEIIDIFISETGYGKEAVKEAVRLLIRQLRPFFAFREGRNDFFYDSFRLAAIDCYEGSNKEQFQRLSTEWHQLLAGYFENLPIWVSKEKNIPTLRRAAELPYHLVYTGKSYQLADLILDYELLETIVFGLGPQAAIDAISLVQKNPVRFGKKEKSSKENAIQLIQGALQLSAVVLSQQPSQLPSHLVGHLLSSNNRTVRKFIQQLDKVVKYPWLCPVSYSFTPSGGPLIRTLTGHNRSVGALAVTPDGSRVISGSFDNTLKIWDLENGRIIRTFTNTSLYNSFTTVAVTPDGSRAISGSRDGTLILWDLDGSQELRRFAGHSDEIRAVIVSPDGHWAVSGSVDATLKVWDLESGRELATLSGHAGAVTSVVVTMDGRRVISGSLDETLKVWDLESGRELATLSGHAGAVTSVAVTMDGHRVICGCWNDILQVWDLDNGQILRTFIGHTLPVTAVAVTMDGRKVVSGSFDKTLKIWDIENGQLLRTFIGHTLPVTAVAVTMDGRKVVSGSEDMTLKLWDITKSQEVTPLAGHSSRIYTLAITMDGRRAVSGSYDKTLKVWDLKRGQEITTLIGHTDRVIAVALTPDGRRAISGSEDTTIKIWDLESGKEIATLFGHEEPLSTVVVSPNGELIISGSYDGTLKVWDLESGWELDTLSHDRDRVYALVLTPEGKRVVSGGENLTVWDLECGLEQFSIYRHIDGNETLVVTPNGLRIVSGWEDLKVWDLKSGMEVANLIGHTQYITSVAVTMDGSRVISGSMDKTLKIWDLESGREIATLSGHTGAVTFVAVTPDDRCVISESDDKTLKIWDLESSKIIAEFHCERPLIGCGYTDLLDSIIVGDSGGRIYILRIKGIDSVSPIMTAMERQDGSVWLKCFFCQQWFELQRINLGSEIICSLCKRKMQLNSFIYKENPF